MVSNGAMDAMKTLRIGNGVSTRLRVEIVVGPSDSSGPQLLLRLERRGFMSPREPSMLVFHEALQTVVESIRPLDCAACALGIVLAILGNS